MYKINSKHIYALFGHLVCFFISIKHIILSYFNLVRGYSQIFNGFLLHYSFARIQTTTQEVFYIVWCVCWCDFGKKNTGVLFKGIYSIVFFIRVFKSTNEAIANICSSCVCGRTLDFPVLFFSYVRQKNRVFFFFVYYCCDLCK